MEHLTERVIIHLDLDAFYAQVEQVRLGIDPNRPLCVQQWSGLIAVNYPARAKGIKRHCSVQEALGLCPDLVLVHVATYAQGQTEPKYHLEPNKDTHKVSLDMYRKASSRIMKILKEMCPHFQRASIDEAYLDVTSQINDMILSHSWEQEQDENGPIVHWDAQSFQAVETVDVSRGWSDLQLHLASKLSQSIRSRIFRELGYTCSTGIAHNKTLAKLISSLNKPDRQTVLRKELVIKYMETIPMTKIKGLGGKFGDQIEKACSVNMASDLWSFSMTDLQSQFGMESGEWIYNICRGICLDPVKEVNLSKSISSVKNIRPPLLNDESSLKWIDILACEIYTRVLDEYDTNQRWPKSLIVHIRCHSLEKSKSCLFPLRKDVTSPEILSKTVWNLIKPQLQYPCSMISISAQPLLKQGKEVTYFSNWLMNGSGGSKGSQEPLKPLDDLAPKSNRVLESKNNEDPVPKKQEILHTLKEKKPNPSQTFKPNKTLPFQTLQGFKIQCDQCEKWIQADEESLLSHSDFHFALTLQQQESHYESKQRLDTLKKPVKDKKSWNRQGSKVTDFFHPYQCK